LSPGASGASPPRVRGFVALTLGTLLAAGCSREAESGRPEIATTSIAGIGGFRVVVEAVLPTIVFIETEATPPLTRAVTQGIWRRNQSVASFATTSSLPGSSNK